MQITSDRIVWDKDDFLAGMVPAQSTGMRIFGVRGAAFMTNVNPAFVPVPGSLAPGRVPVDLTNVSASVPDTILVAAVNDPTAVYAYAIGGAKVHRIDSTTDTLSIAGGWPATAALSGVHAAHTTLAFTLGDIVIYQRAGVLKAYYSYNDNTDWDVGEFDLSATFDDDFMSSVPTTPLGTTAADLTGGVGKPHPLYVAQDDIMYIGSRRYVHSYSGTTSTFVSQDLDIGQLFDVTSFAETDFDLVVFATNAIASGRRGTARAFFWDAARPESFYKAIDLEDDNVRAAFKYHGTIGCFTQSRSFGGWTTLRLLQGNRFVPIFTYSGNMPGNRGVMVMNDMIFWNAGGLLYAWGGRDSKFPNGAFQITSGLGTTDGGVLTSLINGILYASSGVGTSGGIQAFSGTTYHSSALWHSLTACPNFPRGFKGKVKEVKVTFAQASSAGRTLTLLLRTGSSEASSITVAAITTVASTSMVQRFTAQSDGTDLPDFENLKFTASWSTGSGSAAAPALEKIEVFFEPTKIK